MKPKVILILLPLFIASCYSSQHYTMEPSNPRYTQWDQERLLASDMEDSISISIGYDEYFGDQFIMDLVIENLSDSMFYFNPQDVYVICYQNDSTIASDSIYRPLLDAEVLGLCDEAKKNERKKIAGNIIGGLFVLTAAVIIDEAIWDSEAPSILASEAVWLGHEVTQALLVESSFKSASSIKDIDCRKEFYNENIMRDIWIREGDYYSGKLHLHIPYSPKYKIYVPVNNRVFGFAFTAK